MDTLTAEAARHAERAANGEWADGVRSLALCVLRIRLEHTSGGLPDLHGRTKTYQRRIRAAYEGVREEHPDVVRSLEATVRAAYRTVLAEFISEIEHSPERWRFAHVIERAPHLAPSDAIREAYAASGVSLPEPHPALDAIRRATAALAEGADSPCLVARIRACADDLHSVADDLVSREWA